METQNLITLLGIAETDVEERENINGTKVKCWHILLRTDRHSGTPDYEQIYFTEKTEQELLPFVKGMPVMVIGKMQTAKDFKTNRVLAFVAADYIGVVQGENYQLQNDVKIVGKLGKGIEYRVKKSGKRITNLMLEVPSVFRVNTNCYIPCICWQSVADKAKDWQVGDEVELTGRLQSRDFIKKQEGAEDIKRTIYEVSICKITRL